jgi:hypothetical protein
MGSGSGRKILRRFLLTMPSANRKQRQNAFNIIVLNLAPRTDMVDAMLELSEGGASPFPNGA